MSNSTKLAPLFSIRIYKKDFERLEAIAEKENRSLNNTIQTIFLKISEKLEDDVVNKGQRLLNSLTTINPPQSK